MQWKCNGDSWQTFFSIKLGLDKILENVVRKQTFDKLCDRTVSESWVVVCDLSWISPQGQSNEVPLKSPISNLKFWNSWKIWSPFICDIWQIKRNLIFKHNVHQKPLRFFPAFAAERDEWPWAATTLKRMPRLVVWQCAQLRFKNLSFLLVICKSKNVLWSRQSWDLGIVFIVRNAGQGLWAKRFLWANPALNWEMVHMTEPSDCRKQLRTDERNYVQLVTFKQGDVDGDLYLAHKYLLFFDKKKTKDLGGSDPHRMAWILKKSDELSERKDILQWHSVTQCKENSFKNLHSSNEYESAGYKSRLELSGDQSLRCTSPDLDRTSPLCVSLYKTFMFVKTLQRWIVSKTTVRVIPRICRTEARPDSTLCSVKASLGMPI